MKILHEPTPKSFRPDTDHERLIRHIDSALCLLAAVAFCWWLGSHIHAAVVAGSRPFVAAANQISDAVSGR